MWVDNSQYRYQDKGFLTGYDLDSSKTPFKVGLPTETHAITIAGAGSGKGVAVIIPNLLHWQHNILVIDPKGEAVEATAKQREAMGQTVHVVAPFDEGTIESRFLASYNPLDSIDIDSLTARDDVELIADGIVLENPQEPNNHWDEGARSLISGVIAIVLLTQPKEQKNLITVREIIADKGLLEEVMEKARAMEGLDGLARDGASAYYAQEAGYFVSNAEKHTRWLGNKAMRRVLETSSFSLSDLKHGDTSVYLVLPARYIGRHGRFLRLFVRCAIEAMQQEKIAFRDKQCLFLLDEFFALGYINEIAVSCGLMRGYGLQLWPILQDLGQLQKLYGTEGAQTFFGSADLHQFFGNKDELTLNYISQNLGGFSLSELMDKVHLRNDYKHDGWAEADAHHNRYVSDTNRDAIASAQRQEGKSRVAPDEVSKIIANDDDGLPISRRAICFIRGRQFMLVNLLPYWMIEQLEQAEIKKDENRKKELLAIKARNQISIQKNVAEYEAKKTEQKKFSKRRRIAIYAVLGYGALWLVITIFDLRIY